MDTILRFIDAQTLVSALTLVIVVHVILVTVAYLIYLERKISAYIQDRIGPNRTGFDFGFPQLSFLKGLFGLGQSLADGLKFVLKEDYTPARVDKVLFTLAPIIVIIPALIGFAVIPWGGRWEIPTIPLPFGYEIPGGLVTVAGANINVGIVYMVAVASLGVYGITLGGYASNNKYSFLGGLRSTAQMISYEIPLGLSILATLLLVGSLVPERIIGYQTEHGWLIFSQPIAAVLFFTAILAEANRAPFDNAEAEQELVGGYHTEYSAMRFAMYFLAEYAHMVTSSAFFAMFFLGGWDVVPFMDDLPAQATGLLGIVVVLAKFGVFFGKVILLVSFMMLIRWSLPRFRYDQVMMMGWQGMIPVSLAVVVVTSFMVYLGATSMPEMLMANLALGLALILLQPLLPKQVSNKRIALYGSRFSPAEGDPALSYPTNPMAREDRPAEGTAQPSAMA
ncbi:MAG: NADH-quinone oxidoreductase subunit H [Phycisphaerales bacterium]|jgi:NADH-quinone oxidoreductase subunit H|nr:NADH-quinone oxidoreductase subunit H [Phycisphaerales bacterium]